MTPADYAKARRTLMRRDPILGAVMKQCGPCGLADAQHTDPFKALVGAIVSQQLSVKAAATIQRRFEDLFRTGRRARFPTPEQVMAVSDDALRGVGLSRMKVSFIRDLCRHVMDGSLRLRDLDTLDDEEVIRELVAVKGIGRWTAEMFLMFRLHRPDVLPVGDLGIVRGFQKVYGWKKDPSPAKMTRTAEAWRPYRSIACWYLWEYLENAPVTNPTKTARKD
ncbi:MAG: DNA-3-methyladenine glycosylase [Vicinamibacterales bacterium]